MGIHSAYEIGEDGVVIRMTDVGKENNRALGL